MVNILVFGDSIVAGRGVAKSKSWVSLLCQYFDRRDNGNFLIYNLGIPGESTQEILKRVKAESRARSLHRSPADKTLIFFAIGLNDSKGLGSPRNFKTPVNVFNKNLKELIKIARISTLAPVFIGPTPVDEKKTAPIDGHTFFLNENIHLFNQIIKQICDEEQLIFVDILGKWLKEDYKTLLFEDGVHLNASGHRRIFQMVLPILKSKIEKPIENLQILKREYPLSNEDLKTIDSQFIQSNILQTSLVLGQLNKQKPEVVFGGPCIRKDLEGISLNTFYQIFMPLKVASLLKIPCKIVLAIQEEIILFPQLELAYKKLGEKIENAIYKIARHLKVAAVVVNTSLPENNGLIRETIKKLNINLSEEDSRYLFNLSSQKPYKPKHNEERILISKRVLACHSLYLMNKVSRKDKFLIVEDLEQYSCDRYVKRFENELSANFLAFLPLPNLSGTSCMFKSNQENRLLLSQSQSYYENMFIKSPYWVIDVYKEIFKLVNDDSSFPYQDPQVLYQTIQKISSYFD